LKKKDRTLEYYFESLGAQYNWSKGWELFCGRTELSEIKDGEYETTVSSVHFENPKYSWPTLVFRFSGKNGINIDKHYPLTSPTEMADLLVDLKTMGLEVSRPDQIVALPEKIVAVTLEARVIVKREGDRTKITIAKPMSEPENKAEEKVVEQAPQEPPVELPTVEIVEQPVKTESVKSVEITIPISNTEVEVEIIKGDKIRAKKYSGDLVIVNEFPEKQMFLAETSSGEHVLVPVTDVLQKI